MEGFINKSAEAMGGGPAGASGGEWQPERVLIIVSDSKWRLNELKDSTGQLAEEEKIISQVKASYDRIYTVMGSEKYDSRNTQPSYGLNRFAKPTPKSILFDSG